jgi:phenylacetate-CoA ligase
MSLEDKLYPLLSLYERMPRSIKRSAGLVYRILPERIRRGKNYGHFKQLAQAGETWNRERIATYQLKELRKTLHHANAYCPFYQKQFAQAQFRPEYLQSFEDLSSCPFLEKSDLLSHRDELASTAIPAKNRLYITTGGSTGVPVGFYLQKGVSRPKEQAFLETIWKRGGYFDGARLALLRGHVTSSNSNGSLASYDATRNWLMLSSYHLTAERLPLYLKELHAFKPDLLYVYPSAALQFAEYLQTTGLSWNLPLRGILCGSERLTSPQKKLLETIFKCRPYSWYGHSERVVLAAEGRTSSYYYFVPQYGYVEFGPPDSEGLQEVIGTSFHNMAMPLIRYRTGDYVRVVTNDSELEYPWIAVSEIAGREHEFLVSGSGRKISLTAFNMHDAVFDELYAVQFYQERPGFAEFRYVAGPKFQASRIPAIEGGIRRKLGDDFQVELKAVREVEKTSAGKHKWLVSRLN